ncbi:protein of unknown function [Methylocaldum szegediense]|uniref:Uncharacterized protein n=1 Tax=Methylocaldum szegediense TaxID=73780 RepID=A0ABM9HWI8_9GAMM|nr:protein of unknown function [Methylocaldum szegediense]
MAATIRRQRHRFGVVRFASLTTPYGWAMRGRVRPLGRNAPHTAKRRVFTNTITCPKTFVGNEFPTPTDLHNPYELDSGDPCRNDGRVGYGEQSEPHQSSRKGCLP